MPIVQQASGTATASGTFAVALPAASTTGNRVVVTIVSDNTIATPAGWTLRDSQVNFVGHYLWDRAADGSTSYNFTLPTTGQVDWWIAELPGGTFDVSSSANNTAQATSYAGPPLTPTAGRRVLIASFGNQNYFSTYADTYTWSGAWSSQAFQTFTAAPNTAQGVAIQDLASVTGSYTATASYTLAGSAALCAGRSAIMASYVVTATSPVNMAGVVATAAAVAPVGTVSAARALAVTGVAATATATAPAGSVLTGGAAGVSGLAATATATAPAGTVTASSSGSGGAWVAGDPWVPSAPWASGGTPVALAGPVAATVASAPAGTVFDAAVVSLAGPTATASCFAPSGQVAIAAPPTYLLNTPTRDVFFRLAGRGLVASQPYALSMWRTAGEWHTGLAPSAAELLGADRYYQGGYLHVLALDARDELIAAGFGSLISEIEESL